MLSRYFLRAISCPAIGVTLFDQGIEDNFQCLILNHLAQFDKSTLLRNDYWAGETLQH